MCEHLDSHGARVVGEGDLDNFSLDDLRRGYLVVPHDAELDLATLPDRAGSAMTLVTNWWVECCLFGKCLVDPAGNILCRPFDKLSISGELLINHNSSGRERLRFSRFFWADHPLHGVRRYRATPCDKTSHSHGYEKQPNSLTSALFFLQELPMTNIYL